MKKSMLIAVFCLAGTALFAQDGAKKENLKAAKSVAVKEKPVKKKVVTKAVDAHKLQAIEAKSQPVKPPMQQPKKITANPKKLKMKAAMKD